METKKVYALYIGKNPVKIQQRTGIDGGYSTVSIGVVELFNGNKIINPSEDTGLRDLAFHAQWNRERKDWGTYGWSARYEDVYSVDFNDAARMYKTLAKVAKIESHATLRPTSFGQFVVLVAMGLGIKKLVRLTEYVGSSYSDNDHQILDMKDAQFVIDRLIAAAQEEDAKAKV